MLTLEGTRTVLKQEESQLLLRLQGTQEAAAPEAAQSGHRSHAAPAEQESGAEQDSCARRDSGGQQDVCAHSSANAGIASISAPLASTSPVLDSSGSIEHAAATVNPTEEDKSPLSAPEEDGSPPSACPEPHGDVVSVESQSCLGSHPAEDCTAVTVADMADHEADSQHKPAARSLEQGILQGILQERRPVPSVGGMSTLRAAVVGAAADRSCGAAVAVDNQQQPPLQELDSHEGPQVPHS